MPNPRFSIIVPTYNRAAFIRQTVDSVLRQTYRDFEIIIVDDGSTDETESVVREIKDERLRYIKQANRERASARNRGIQEARGEYVNFLDSDDVQHNSHLKNANEYLEKVNPDVFHFGYDVKDPDGNLIRIVADIRSVTDQILDGNILSCNGVFAKRNILLQNPFNEDRTLSALEDWELWIRLSARYNFRSENIVTSTVIHHPERSVVSDDGFRIVEKVNVFVKYVMEDARNVSHYGAKLRRATASAYTYAALHLLIAKSGRSLALSYFWKGVRQYPGVVLTKRSVIIVLKLIGIR